jgi:eukaryotic-like serine/threonine-protein kinase
MPDLDLPKIGKYEIQADLGQGGFGKVYRAFDPTVGRPVAIKILTVEGNQDLLTRFRNEATAAGKLKHRNIVTIYEFGEYNGRPYLVMELLEGQDLVQVIKDGVKLSLLQKMNIMDQVADGLDCAHRNGIIHRDIKPGNIRLLPDGTVKIMDFGVARVNRERDETRLTQQGDLIGTILYMSPEQFSGGVADALSDIFAYGVTYYELLTGEHPFKSTDPARVMFKISMEDPQPLRSLVPECPESLEQIINRAIQKDREMRYQGLRDLRVDTEPLLFELEQERAGTLAVDAQRLFDAGDFNSALAIIHEALELDSGNRAVRQLRETIQRELQKQALRSRLQVMLQTAEEQLARREFAPAVQTLESAFKLDQTNEHVRASLEAARADLQRYKDSARMAAAALGDLRRKDFAGAYEKAAEAARLDPLNKDAVNALAAAREHIAILDRLREIDVLRTQGDFDSALRDLRKLASGHPDSREVQKFLEETVARQAAASRIAAASNQAREYFDQSRFGDAVECLSSALRDFPEEPGVLALLGEAKAGLEAQQRTQAIEQAVRTAESLKAAADLDGALRELDKALSLFPGESRLTELSRAVRIAQSAREQDLFVNDIVQQGADLRASLRFSEALDAVQAGLRRYNQDPALLRLEAELQKAYERRQHADAARRSMEAGRFQEAVEGLEKAASRDPEATELQGLLSQAKVELEAQKKNQAIERVVRQAEVRTKREDFKEALQILEKALDSWPGEARILELIQSAKEGAQQQLERQQRAKAVVRLVQEGQRLLGQSETARALEMLEKACAEYPEASELQGLLAQARERRESVERAEREAQVYAKRREFHQALQILEKALQLWPGEGRLSELIQTTRAARADYEREQAIEEIVREAKLLNLDQRYDNALRVVQQGLRTYERAPALMQLEQEMLAQLQRQQRAEAIAQCVEEGRLLLSQGQSLRAVEALEKSSGNYPEAVELQNLLQQARERQAGVAQAAREAQGWVDRGDLNRGLQILEQALEFWPGEVRLLELLQSTREAAQQRLRAVRVAVEKSNQLRMIQRLAEALAAVQSGLQEYEGEPVLIQLEQELREQLERQQRAEAVARVVQEGQRLLGQNQTARSLEMLEKACAEYPETPELQTLLAQVRERWEGVERATREAQACVERRDFNRASQILEEASQLWPAEGRLADLIQAIPAARAAYEREQAIETIVREAKRLDANQQYDDALLTVRAGLRTYQRAPVLMQLEQEIQAELRMQQRAAAIAQSIGEGQGLLSQGQSLRAVQALEKSLRQYPEAGELQTLLKQARQRQEGVAQAEREAQPRMERKDFAKVVEILHKAVQSWPTEVRLQEFLQTATAALAAQERERAVAAMAREINRLTEKRRFPEALSAVRTALQTYGQEPLLVQLEREVLEERKRSQPEVSRPTAPPASVQALSVPRSGLLLIGVGSVALLAVGFIGLRAFRSNGGVALTLRSNVEGASIVVGDKSCVLPACSLALPAGTYHLTAAKDGYQTLDQTVAVSKSTSEFSLVFQPLPQVVQVNTNFPSGQVFLDGHQAGALRDGQFSLSGVSPGAHTLRITSGTAQFETEWQTATGALPQLQRPFTAKNVQATVIANLGRNGSIFCDCDAGAIKLDGNAVRGTKTGAQGIQLTDLQEGTRRVSIGDRSLLVDLKPNPALNVFLALDRDTGTLVIDANESGAKIYIDDRPYHRLTDRGLRIPLDVARYTIRVEKDGFRSSSPQTIDLAKGEDKQMAFVLEPIRPTLAIAGALPEAQVKVDGRVVGQTDSSGSFRAEVTPGNHVVELTKQDYSDVRLSLGFAPGRTVRPDRSQIAMSRVVKAPPVAAPATATIESKAPESKPTDGQDWDRVRNSNNPDDLEDFIRKHPGSANINDARNRLAQLRSQLDAAAARQAEQAAWNRLDKTSKADLQDFLSQYGAGAHAPDARTLIAGIDKQEAEKEKEQEQANRALADSQLIARTLSAYEAAYNAKDLKAIQSVWQEMPKNMADATRREFGDAKSIGFQIRAIDKPMVNGDSATVNCNRTLSLTLKQGGRQEMPGERVRVTLIRASSGWLIQSITPY